jgi:hypothetical protein
MGTCKNHPDRETNYICAKHGYHLCEECLRCHDPKLYCKYRSSCIINYISENCGEPLCHTPTQPATSVKENAND